jgi:hypothetical protein
MVYLRIFIFSIVLCSCKYSKKTNIYNITSGNKKFWDVVEKPRFFNKANSKTYPLYCFSFDINGRKDFFEYRNGKRIIYDNGDIVLPKTRKYVTDTSIIIDNSMYKIEKLTSDSFIISGKSGKTVLVSSQKQDSF